MRSTITISISEEVQKEVDRISRGQGASRSDVVRQSIRDYLFVRLFWLLGRGMLAKASRRGIYADQDVFDMFS